VNGDTLRNLRLNTLNKATGKPLTQEAAGRALGVTGNTIARYERNEINIPSPVAKLAYLIFTGELDIGPLDDLDDS
jgi:transcriptional regulator with XRE-family HTH domain